MLSLPDWLEVSLASVIDSWGLSSIPCQFLQGLLFQVGGLRGPLAVPATGCIFPLALRVPTLLGGGLGLRRWLNRPGDFLGRACLGWAHLRLGGMG